LPSRGRIQIIGIGPGSIEDMTVRAVNAIANSEYIVGVASYIEQVSSLLSHQKVVQSGMGGEVQRVKQAIELAEAGHVVSIISGGDPNVYGMGGLVLDMLAATNKSIDFEVVPGVTAANAAAAMLGAPLSGDYVSISLSDLLTPWEEIERRVAGVADSGFIIALYNPKSRKRKSNLTRCVELLMPYRASVPVGVVKNGRRPGETTIVTTLDALMDHESMIDMHTTIIVGNNESFVWRNNIVTPRGYKKKYDY
jgi:precorrin-3B C17-methyltransferase